jgi:hypothetical protein
MLTSTQLCHFVAPNLDTPPVQGLTQEIYNRLEIIKFARLFTY